MKIDTLNKLKEDKKYLTFLRENSQWYKVLNRDANKFDLFKSKMKEKYHLRTIDKVDNIVDSVDLITKILDF